MTRIQFSAVFAALTFLLATMAFGYQIDVEMEDLPMQGPKNKPGYVEEKWGSKEEWQKGSVIQLDDNNFEHLTQATSGATTGDWFVMFGAPWCKFCREEMMVLNWNHTSRDLKGEVNVAYIDASNNPFTQLRFNISAYPTFIFIRRGRAYVYTGPRYWKNFVTFARLDWETVDSFEIPPAHGTFDELVYQAQQYSGRLYNLYERRPWLFFGSIVGGILFGCVLPYGYILSAKMDPSFVDVKVKKPKTSATTAVWDQQKGTTELVSIPEETPEAMDASIKQVEVDADTVEIVTKQSGASANVTERKSKKKGKKN